MGGRRRRSRFEWQRDHSSFARNKKGCFLNRASKDKDRALKHWKQSPSSGSIEGKANRDMALINPCCSVLCFLWLLAKH